MAKRIAISNLNASTIDILNTIRANASAEYQALVPKVAKDTDIPRVGEVLFGYPAMANQFINALVNRIAAVRVKSATFNNDYAELKKGYLEFGETVEEVFVSIAKAREFSAEKAEARELKRTLPDVRSAFHTMNWRVQYPVTIQEQDLQQAFLSIDGVQDLIAKIVDSVYQAAEYDEFLLFKYLIIKAVSHGKMYPVAFDAADIKNAAIAFRGTSNQLTFMSNKYNAAGVTTNTQKADQYIFMDSTFNAQYDVNVLAGAFNMDKADFIGRLKLIDDFTTFDNERFSDITANSDMIEAVTADELALMADVKAVLLDKEWFQVYDNNNKFTEDYIGAGMYWNYWYNVWKTISSSPFSNAVVFVENTATTALPATLNAEITAVQHGDGGIIYTLEIDDDNASLEPHTARFVQTQACVQALVTVHPYGAFIVPGTGVESFIPVATLGGATYTGTAVTVATAKMGDTITLTKG
jgi:hypothetical protein